MARKVGPCLLTASSIPTLSLSSTAGTANRIVGLRTVQSPLLPVAILGDLSVRVAGEL